MMNISARNQIAGKVSSVKAGAVNGVVAIEFGAGVIKADITMEAIEELGLKEGVKAAAVIKASNVMFAAGDKRIENLSARNQFPGKITALKKGAVNGHVTVTLADGTSIKGSVTNEAIDELGLDEGKDAVAIIKSTDVMVATF